jgi:hypothetical protein
MRGDTAHHHHGKPLRAGHHRMETVEPKIVGMRGVKAGRAADRRAARWRLPLQKLVAGSAQVYGPDIGELDQGALCSVRRRAHVKYPDPRLSGSSTNLPRPAEVFLIAWGR